MSNNELKLEFNPLSEYPEFTNKERVNIEYELGKFKDYNILRSNPVLLYLPDFVDIFELNIYPFDSLNTSSYFIGVYVNEEDITSNNSVVIEIMGTDRCFTVSELENKLNKDEIGWSYLN
jgi:hypothetical protein